MLHNRKIFILIFICKSPQIDNWSFNVDFDVVKVAEVTSWFLVLNQKQIKTNSSNKRSVIWKEQTTKLNKFVGFALKRMETHQWSLSHCHNEKDTFSRQRAGVIVTLWKQFQTLCQQDWETERSISLHRLSRPRRCLRYSSNDKHPSIKLVPMLCFMRGQSRRHSIYKGNGLP